MARYACFFCLGLLLLLGTAASPAAASRPFKGHAEGMVTGVTLTGFILEYTGQATHLGQFTRTEEVSLNPDTGAFEGTIVFTAANGDQLWVEFTGQFTSATTAEGIYTIVGGTGRFTDATGTANFEASTALSPEGALLAAVTFEGTIDY
jgi:hypothetical protein